MGRAEVRGRLVLDDAVVVGRLTIEDGMIAAVDLEDGPGRAADLPHLAPGFVDVHVHGWGGFDAMGDAAALDGMARALLRQGVTSFLPTGVTAPLPVLHAWADRARAWMRRPPADGAHPLGFNLEGPFIAHARKGAHNPALLLDPADVPWSDIEPLVDGLTVMTVAPEIPGGLALIRRLTSLGVRISIGHSNADLADALGGAVGATLPAVDLGLAPVSRQVGQSGKFITPALYFAVGMSGTPQHLAGIGSATRLVAVNSDRHAPIFRFAETGAASDARILLPLVLQAVEAKLGSE